MAKNAPPPSSPEPAGVPTGGGGKFVVVAVALIGLIIAAVAWKKCSKPPEQPLPKFDAAPPPINSGRNVDDDIPLPPVIEDAGPDAGRKVVIIQQNGQCDVKKCGGSTTSELETALNFRVKQAHRCYDNALAQDPTLRGKVTLQVRIGSNGMICSSSIASNDMSTPNVGQCVVNTYFRGANFPAPKNGCVDVNVPINFVPHQ